MPRSGRRRKKTYEVPAMPLESLLFTRKPKLSLPPSTLEYEISIAASLAHYFIAQKRAVGLVAQDRTYTVITAERSQRQENKILETLAFIEGKGELSIAALASRPRALAAKGIDRDPVDADHVRRHSAGGRRSSTARTAARRGAACRREFWREPRDRAHRAAACRKHAFRCGWSNVAPTWGRRFRARLHPPLHRNPQHGKDRHCHT